MNSSKKALFIGRFQPFHLGHLDAVQQILEENDFVFVGIGSAEDSYLPENPFTAGERFEMIERNLLAVGISPHKFAIVAIRNIDNFALWPKHVENYLPKFGCVYTGSEIVQILFENHSTIPVKKLQFRHSVSATAVRAALKKGLDISELVPKATADFLLEIDAAERLQKIA